MLDATNSTNIAFGTTAIKLDSAQGTGGWPTTINLPGITGRISALHYVNSNLIYAATSSGEVYRATRSGTTWAASALHAAPLPSRWIWDVTANPANPLQITVVMAGFGTAHVWRGTVAASGTSATWADISGTGANRLPDIPVNALILSPTTPTTMYAGTDIGIFRTTDNGVNWFPFSDGLPNTAIYDLKFHAPTQLLRAATHGRGIWERKLDVATLPDVQLYLRDNIMDTGRVSPSPSGVAAAFEDPLQHVALGDQVWWWHCADVKIDALAGSPPMFQLNVADVNYLTYETLLAHRDPQRGRLNRVYVQVHNRGIQAATNVTVKILYADASGGVLDLPVDFWSRFPADSMDTSYWHPIGAAQTVSVLPTQPAILEWDWTPPTSAADHSCLLVVMDCPSDPIPAAHKVTNIATLVNTERRVSQKNLHLITPPPGPAPHLTILDFNPRELSDVIRVLAAPNLRWNLSIVLPTKIAKKVKGDRFKTVAVPQDMLEQLRHKLPNTFKQYDGAPQFRLDAGTDRGSLTGLAFTKGGIRALLVFSPVQQRASGGSVTIVHESKQRIIGGNTFVLLPARGR